MGSVRLGVTDIAPDIPAEAPFSQPVEPEVTLRTVRFTDGTFYAGVDGVDPITMKGTRVPASKVAAVLQAAQGAHVAIEED